MAMSRFTWPNEIVSFSGTVQARAPAARPSRTGCRNDCPRTSQTMTTRSESDSMVQATMATGSRSTPRTTDPRAAKGG